MLNKEIGSGTCTVNNNFSIYLDVTALFKAGGDRFMSKKTKIRIFTIAEFKDEEEWLREQHRNGWKLAIVVLGCIYKFEKCQSEDVIYRIDFKSVDETRKNMPVYTHYGWEYIGNSSIKQYFRTLASEYHFENECKVFPDIASMIKMIQEENKLVLISNFTVFFLLFMHVVYEIVESKSFGFFDYFFLILLFIMCPFVYYSIKGWFKFHKLKKKL